MFSVPQYPRKSTSHSNSIATFKKPFTAYTPQMGLMSVLLWVDKGSIPIEATCLDFNARGMLLKTAQAILPGNTATTSLYRLQDKSFISSYQTKVLRCEKSKDGLYAIGLAILKT